MREGRELKVSWASRLGLNCLVWPPSSAVMFLKRWAMELARPRMKAWRAWKASSVRFDFWSSVSGKLSSRRAMERCLMMLVVWRRFSSSKSAESSISLALES